MKVRYFTYIFDVEDIEVVIGQDGLVELTNYKLYRLASSYSVV